MSLKNFNLLSAKFIGCFCETLRIFFHSGNEFFSSSLFDFLKNFKPRVWKSLLSGKHYASGESLEPQKIDS